jgi:uncharacterized membrane protein
MKREDLDDFALKVTEKVGTIGFFIVIILWTIVWLGWNSLAPQNLRFDPYPAFVLWLFISNMIQICLMPLIMIGQNLQSEKMEKVLNQDYKLDEESSSKMDIIIKLLEEIKNENYSEYN